MFEYKYFYAKENDIEHRLNCYGPDGWRLHTCEPVQSPTTSTIRGAFVVMDRIVIDEDEQTAAADKPSAMGMKG